jgi:hypothetical protein
MSVLIAILLALITLVILIVVIGYNTPKIIIVDVSKTFDHSADKIFLKMGNFREFVQWSPWAVKDPNIKQQFIGEPFTVGSTYLWEGNRSVGSGSLRIEHIEANERIDFTLNFGPQGDVKTSFILVEQANQTMVTWHFESDMGSNPFYRFFGNMMRGYLKKDFAQGLNNLTHLLASND